MIVYKQKFQERRISQIFFCLFVPVFLSIAQREIKPTFSLGAGYTSDKYTPFWLRANQNGEVPTTENYVNTGLKFKVDYRKGQKIDWAYGASARLNLGDTKSDFLLQEAYIKGKWGIFELSAGRIKYIQGLADSTLSSGSYILSGNALPMPKIEIVVNNYWSPKFLKGILAFKGNYVHGWFESARTNPTQVWLHQKSFYGRLGKQSWPVRFYGGFNHQVQWGGSERYKATFSKATAKPTNVMKDYLSVVTGISLGLQGDTATYGVNEGFNRLGNHLGTVDVGMEVELAAGKLLMYRQSIYEDGSLYYGNNITDGLHGISFTRNAKHGIIKVVVEYLNTTSQGGPGGSDNTDPFKRGQDNYLNNGLFPEGWSYYGKGLGTPLLTLGSETDLTPGGAIGYDNNRVEAFYVAAEAQVGLNHLVFKGSLSNAIGFYGREYVPVKRQTSLGLMWSRPVYVLSQNAILQANLGFDLGSWKKDVFGGNISLSIPLYP